MTGHNEILVGSEDLDRARSGVLIDDLGTRIISAGIDLHSEKFKTLANSLSNDGRVFSDSTREH
jgi:hypothetical protein